MLLRRPREEPLGVRGWVAVLLALFWSRQLFNALVLLASSAGAAGDEISIADQLGWPSTSLAFGTAAVGLVVCLWVAFVAVPRASRLPLLAGGGLGSLVGFAIWNLALGPWLLP
ncbi:MAG: hypothetical protein GY711_30135 [bacterium]|nr:hypothetical protein [bacterium]